MNFMAVASLCCLHSPLPTPEFLKHSASAGVHAIAHILWYHLNRMVQLVVKSFHAAADLQPNAVMERARSDALLAKASQGGNTLPAARSLTKLLRYIPNQPKTYVSGVEDL